ncbi:NB-ARC domain-containing protein [Kribbella qitaiheensis]|uniref:NB-ARC domain-containing protein n=1 Tax=Kribbella qitaiheensis TaxID=1544730 RepID=UPI001625092F|nr:NB-ARC domain-containing protein [Kribbella qitaiheensis]
MDRVEQRELMVRQLTVSRAADLPCLLYVHAQEGLGRWSLASQFFHENLEAFAETYIEVAARQADGRPVSPGEMLGQALRGLGLDDAEHPPSDQARADRFQRLSVGRTYLMVIRDVVAAEQVELLVPSSPGVTLVVTTRANLRKLQEYDFLPVSLENLPPDDAHRLMVDKLKVTAAQIDPDTLRELVALCYGHPLLIRIVAAQVSGRAHVARRLVDEAVGPVVLPGIDSSGRLAASFDQVYETLDDDLKLPYRLLAFIPGPDFGVPAAAMALDTDYRSAAKLIDDLVDANMLRPNVREGRFMYLPLLRSDAKERVDDRDDRRAVVRRVTEWYLTELAPRDFALARRWRVGKAFESPGAVVDRADALEWFSVEWESGIACVTAAATNEQHEVAYQLCIGLHKYFHQQGHRDSWLDCLAVGLSSAELAGSSPAVMQLSSHRGSAYLAAGHPDAARKDFQSSLECAMSIGHRMGEQSAQEWLGKVSAKETDFDEALRRYDASEAVIQRATENEIPDSQRSRMIALLGLHRARATLDQAAYSTAATWIGGALRYFDQQTPEAENRAKCLMVLGSVASKIATGEDPVGCFEEAARALRCGPDAAI